MTRAFRIGLVADPHYHELLPEYGFADMRLGDRAGAAIRTLADTLSSTRIFNESADAFRAVLDGGVEQGLTTVVIVGDLTDDGQVSNLKGAAALLDDYERRHGIRFFLTPGNHDLHALSGRDHRSPAPGSAIMSAVICMSTTTPSARSASTGSTITPFPAPSAFLQPGRLQKLPGATSA